MTEANLNIFTQPSVAARRRPLTGVMAQFVLAGGAGAALAVGVAFGLTGGAGAALVAVIAVYGFAVGLVARLLWRGFPHTALGLCNLVTLARLALTSGLVAPLVVPTPGGWAVFGVATVALALDGLDGWAARREGRVSAFGARFDVEVDSALALIMALNAIVAGTVGVFVLLIALPRYVFAAATLIWPWMNWDLPERFSRKVVCVAQLATLIALQTPMMPPGIATVLVALVAAALVWSFGRDLMWLRRQRC